VSRRNPRAAHADLRLALFDQFVAFPIVLVGLVVYFCAARPESLEINVVARGKQAAKEAKNGKKVIGENNA